MKIRVLTIDDDPHILSLLQLILEVEQYEVVQVLNGRSASRLLEAHTFHIAVIDVMIPEKNSHALC